MKKRISKLIRILTTPPIMALLALSLLFLRDSTIFGSSMHFILAILFLCVLPLLAYPLQPFIPKFKHKGRDGQRNLAMIFSVCGYLLGAFTTLFLDAPTSLWLIYLAYLISGVLIALVNKVFHKKASGHACGIAGPLSLLVCFGIPSALLLGIPIYFAALWASLEMKRHTLPQFLGGTAIPIAVILTLALLL